MFPEKTSRPGLYLFLVLLLGTALLSSCEQEQLLGVDSLKKGHQGDETSAFLKEAMETPAHFESSDEALAAFTNRYEEKYERTKPLKEEYLQRRPQESVVLRSTSSQTLFVPNDYPSLQAAVDAANQGDEIVITQNLSDQGTVIIAKPELTIRSNDDTQYEVPGNEVIIIANDITISGLKFNLESAVIADGVTGLVFEDNIALSQNWTGMFLLGSSGCQIRNSQFSGFDAGILIVGSNENSFTSNQFTLNGDPGFLVGAMNVFASSKNSISKCRVDGKGAAASYGFWIANGSNENKLDKCTSSNNGIAGFTVISSNENEFSSCMISNSGYGIVLWGSDECLLSKCTANGLPFFAFYLLDNGYDQVENNRLDRCKGTNSNVGVFLNDATGTTITNGIFSGNVRGIQNQFGVSNTITGCQTNGNGIGIRLFGNEQSIVEDCVSNENSNTGILATFTTGAQLHKNITNNNAVYGIGLQECTETTVGENLAQDNATCDFQVEGGLNLIDQGNNNFGTYCNL